MDAQQLTRMYQAFVVDGITVVPPEHLPEVDHDLLYAKAAATYAHVADNPSRTAHLDVFGDTALRQRIPELQALLRAPQLVEVLQSILGEGYFVHPHCYLHEATTKDQVFHQDGNLPWNERGHYRAHRPDWALLFYYPQAVTTANGPTELVPGSQYWTKDFERSDGTYHPGDAFDRSYFTEVMPSEDLAFRDARNTAALASLGVPDLTRRFVTVPKGSVAICHYDIVHRGTRQLPAQPGRYMFKFYFARTTAPSARGWPKPDYSHVRPKLKGVVDDIWHWTEGATLEPTEQSLEEALRWLIEGREDQKVAGAYNLAHLAADSAGEQAQVIRSAMIASLQHDAEGVRRAAAYGIRAMGTGANCAVDLLQHARVSVRRLAAFALGTEALGGDDLALASLSRALREDEDVLVRSNAAYALGQIARSASANPSDLFTTLLERLEPGVEINNTEVALLPRSTVRQSVAYALLQCACNHGVPENALGKLRDLTTDSDRYVAGFATEILERPGVLQAPGQAAAADGDPLRF